jgi:hypothetical protein
MTAMTGYFRCAIVLLSTLLLNGCVGDIDGDLLLRRYVPGEPTPVKIRTTAKIEIEYPGSSNSSYIKKVQTDLGSRWIRYVMDGKDLYTSGAVTISLAITPEGRVRGIHVVKNTSNAEFAALCRHVLEESNFGPSTEEARQLMKDGELKLTLHFIYDSSRIPGPERKGG